MLLNIQFLLIISLTTTDFEPSVNVGSSSSSVRPAHTLSQQEIQQMQLQNRQVGAPSIATSSRISAFTPVVPRHIPIVCSIVTRKFRMCSLIKIKNCLENSVVLL